MKIKAVTVNHNTSRFTELMIRSLLQTSRFGSLDFELTVLDNNSDEEYFASLVSFLNDNNISILQTGFDNTVDVEKHGLSFENFVGNNQDCEFYLFLDSDMWFIEEDTIEKMLSELNSSPSNVFGVQARVNGYYAKEVIEGKNGKQGYTYIEKMNWEINHNKKLYRVQVKDKRCSPVCCLIRNSNCFRKTVKNIGMTTAYVFKVGAIDYYDTFGLMTHAMMGYGKDYIISEKTVNHFTETAYKPEFRGARDKDVEVLLDKYKKLSKN